MGEILVLVSLDTRWPVLTIKPHGGLGEALHRLIVQSPLGMGEILVLVSLDTRWPVLTIKPHGGLGEVVVSHRG
jgi:hypothetical protein